MVIKRRESRPCCPRCEFIGDSVIVGHNVGFDMGFINARCCAAKTCVPQHRHRTLPLAAAS